MKAVEAIIYLIKKHILETGKSSQQLHANLIITKSFNEVFLSRDFVRAILEELNLKTILAVLNSNSVSMPSGMSKV